MTPPVAADPAATRWSSGWTPGGVRLFAGLLVAFQLIQGLSDPIPLGNVRFTESYYLVTYGQGFIRRGLLGEGLHLVFGLPSRTDLDVTADLIVALAVGTVVVLIELLIRRGTAGSWAMAILLAASPFMIDFFVVDRRPDLVALVLLAVLGLVLARAGRCQLGALAAVGLAFGAMVLVHEDVILIEVPWAMVLVATATADSDHVGPRAGRPFHRSIGWRLGAVAGPALLATVAVLAYGLPSSGQVGLLQAGIAKLHFTGNTVFTYLPDSIHTSIGRVGAIPASAKAWTILLGLVLVGLQLAWSHWWVTPRLGTSLAHGRTRVIGIALAAVIVMATVVLFTTGFDWLRWFADCGAAWLIVQACALLLPGRAARSGSLDAHGPGVVPPDRIRLSLWLPALAMYLAAVPPLDDLFITHQFRHFLFFV